MNTPERNLERVNRWLEAVVDTKDGDGWQTLRDEYHLLFRPDAVLFVPGDTQLSGRHVGFDGWLEMCMVAKEIAKDDLDIELEQVVANEFVTAAILQYSFGRDGFRADTRATELRWFGEDGFVYEGEFMASNWAAFSAFFRK